MSEKFEDTPAMEKVFAAAGIEPDAEDNNGNDTQAGAETTSGGQDTKAGADQTDKVQGDVGKDSISGKVDSGKKSGKDKKGEDTPDPNDLVLPDGQRIKAGAERRHYETAQVARQRLQMTQNDLNTTKQKFDALQTKYTELEGTVKQIGLEDATQVATAVRLFKDLATDPVRAITKLLAEFKAKGYSFEGIGGAVDTGAVNALLDRRLPQTSEAQGPTKEQLEKQIDDDVNNFIKDFPDAVLHETYIASLVDQVAKAENRIISLPDAYFALKQKVINDGLDWSKPLGPQLEARKQAKQPADTITPLTPPRANGRANIDNEANETDPLKSNIQTREDTDSIIKAAMRENGYNIQ